MYKFLAIIFAVLLFLTIFQFDVQATRSHFYNDGYHLNCGGAWYHCERDKTGTWFYCDRCGHQHQFK